MYRMTTKRKRSNSSTRIGCRAAAASAATLLVFLLLISTQCSCCRAIEATWTPNEQDENDGGPLPLSQAHRDQLLQLEQAILQSPDPQGTLMQVAEANNMDPQDLVNMLERNHKEMSTGGAPPPRRRRRTVQAWPQTILKGLSSLGWILLQMAHGNPRAFALASLSILFVLHVLIHAPRTGLVMSTGTTTFLSRGATTMFNPPTTYIDKVLESKQFPKYDLSLPKADCKSVSLFDDELPDYLLDGIQVHKLSRKSELVQAVTAQQTLDADDFLSTQNDDDVTESDTERAHVMDTLYDAAAEVLSSRRLTEFVNPPKALRIQSNHEEKRQRSAILVVQKMGNWGRFGLQPLRVSSSQHEGESVASLTFTTLKGGHFDGQIAITVERTKKDTLVIQIRLGIPKKGRKLNEKVATQVVDAIAHSIQKSITTQTRQTLARKSQGKRYHSNYESRTKEKRQIRFENERKAEEMAKDRRRKWQRQNPDAGRYRPSGDRMKSPNNC